jgi:hypothetical protein
MIRRGVTFLEVHMQILMLSLILGAGGGFLASLRGPPRAAQAGAVERVCDRLRRELGDGAGVDADALVTANARWTVAKGYLCRNRVPQMPVEDASWRRSDGAWLVEILPAGLPARTLRVRGPGSGALP